MCGSIILGIALSAHIGFTEDYNEVHPNLTCKVGNVSSTVYHNSEDNVSVAGFYTFDVAGGVSLDAGVVTGYSAGPLMPLAKLNYDYKNITVSIIPGVEKDEFVGVVGTVNLKLMEW